MASLWKKSNSANYYYRFMHKGKTYQGTTGKPNRKQAQRKANEKESEIKQSFVWQVAYERLQNALNILPVEEQVKIRRDIAQELLTSTGKTLSISKAFDDWLELPKPRSQTDRTRNDYKSIWDGFQIYISKTFADIKDMHEITKGIAQKYMASIWDSNVSEGTYNKKLVIINALFEALKEDIGLPDNPFKTIPKKEKRTASRKPFSKPQIKQLIESAEGEYKTLIYLGAFLGTRLGDAVNMKWDSVDFDNKKIRYIPSKTKSYDRDIVIEIQPNLLKHLETLSQKNEYITPSLYENYKKDPSSISKAFNEIAKSIGIKTTKKRDDGRGQASSIYGYHSLRHSFISNCKNSGIPQHIVMQWVPTMPLGS